jgi:hypothetical protein
VLVPIIKIHNSQSQNYKLLYFVYIPKTGGTSVENFFSKNGYQISFLIKEKPKLTRVFSNSTPQHIDKDVFRLIFAKDLFDHLFCFTRHPVRRFISAYKYHYSLGHINKSMDINALVNYIKVKNPTHLLDNHFIRMSDFISSDYKTVVFKLEDGFENFIAWLRKEVGMNIIDEHFETSNRSNQQFDEKLILMNNASLNFIYDFYHKDFVNFSYDKSV